MEHALLYPGNTDTRGMSDCSSLLLSPGSRFANLGDRLCAKLDAEKVKDLSKDGRRSGGRVDVHSITAEEVLEQVNKIFTPYRVKFASPLSWFAVWNGWLLCSIHPSLSATPSAKVQNHKLTSLVSERVARSFSSPDLRIHLGGDAA